MEEKLKKAVEEAKKLEQLNAQNVLNKVREQYETQLTVLDGKVKSRDESIAKLQKEIKDLGNALQNKNLEIDQLYSKIKDLE